MSRIRFNRKKVKIKGLLGIRARLVLLALILVGPLMVERIRSLEDTRARQASQLTHEFSNLAIQSAAAQQQVISSVEAVLKSSAYIHSSAGQIGRSCAIMRASLRDDLPWITGLSVLSIEGTILCSTTPGLVGTNLGDRDYFKKTLELQDFVVSDYLFHRGTHKPAVIAAYPVPGVEGGSDAVIVASVNLDWLSRIMSNLGGRPGVSAFLLDGSGVVVATPADEASMIGHPLDNPAVLSAIKARSIYADNQLGSVSVTNEDGSQRTLSFARVSGTNAHLVVSIDEARALAGSDREIRTAYLQLGFVCLFVLLGALVVAERIIIQPIEMMATVAKRFGHGDWSARVPRTGLPAEYVPLARALNGMAAQLGERERELLAHNDRLTVMASIDVLSGLANRRGFQSRLDFEWLKAQQGSSDLALMMIDVDHFKLFNDTYGHPEGDACLARIGAALATIAEGANGFAARYGGEEFCLLLPNTGVAEALEVGELLRTAVWSLTIPHVTSAYQHVTVSVGVACAAPNELQEPSDLIEAADAALYAAKHRGRNTIVEHGFVRITDKGLSMAS
jgi:diguanylate cyclase (GGDEF)-like protein